MKPAGGDRGLPVAPSGRPGTPRAAWTALGLAAAALAALGWLAQATAWPTVAAWDCRLLNDLAGWRSPDWDRAFGLVTDLGSPWFLLAVATLAGLVGSRRERLLPLMALFLALPGSALLKAWFARPRPGPEFHPLVLEPYASLPSGHAMLSLCVYGSLAGLVLANPGARRWRGPVVAMLALLVLLIGLSRVYLAVHYPSDVLAGYAAAIPILCGILPHRTAQEADDSRRR